jgi:transcriptional regulator with XRE-family HTH domain
MSAQLRSTALDPLVHRLVGELEERGLAREAVSLDAGLGKDTIGSWARGQRTPNIGNLRAALQVVGLAIDCTPLDGVTRNCAVHSESSLSGIPCDSGETLQK